MIAETQTSGGFVGESDRSARDLEGEQAARGCAPRSSKNG